MLRLLKRILFPICLLVLSFQSARAFSIIGPSAGYPGLPADFGDTWQVPENGYNPNGFIDPVASGPKNIGEDYRRNTPVLFYSFDQNFLDFFGSNGVAAVEEAFSIYNSLTNVSQYSSDLSEFPLETRRLNFEAQALLLTDLKSTTLHFITEQLGLAEPERYTWGLHQRVHFNGTPPCPDGMGYEVVKRNFDVVPSPLNQFQYSSYVNGTLYSYFILEVCTPAASPFPPMLADAVEYLVDPTATAFSSVAAGSQQFINGGLLYSGSGLGVVFPLPTGGFYQGLTRDDVGGLRYLLRTNNMHIESTGPNTVTFVTNNTIQLLFTSNLVDLVNLSLVSPAATLQALYPGLIVTSETPYFTNVIVTNLTAFLTNFPWEPVGTLPHTVFATNLTTTIVLNYLHTFANIVTNQVFNNGVVIVQGTTVAPCPTAPVGIFCTNNTQQTFKGQFGGDFYVIPPGLCEIKIIASQLTNVIATTNVIVSTTNVTTGATFTQSIISFFTNHVFVINPVVCPANTIALRQGVERISFVRRDFDSLLGRFFSPTTNDYFINAITNNVILSEKIRRTIAQPDILFSADDQAGPPGGAGFGFGPYTHNINFNFANKGPRLAGPGTIENPTQISFNKVGPTFLNQVLNPTFFLDEATAGQFLIWASFDGSTNPPVVYPNGTSLVNLENQALIQIGPDSLPDATRNLFYNAQLTVNGGSQPFTWSLTPESAGLPPGLTLSSDGLVSGTPTAVGTFDFIVRLTDGGARFVDRNFSIRVNP